jgi:ribosome maturation factor RimP
MQRKTILNLAEEAIANNDNLFIIELKISAGNKINLIIDGDNGVALQECIRVNKYIESHLDREDEDYSLEVSSPDISEPLKNSRQYKKNLGRILKLKTKNKQFEGKLVALNQDSITIQWKAREPKPIGKGKVTVEKNETINFDEIIETKVKIIFN